LVHNSHIEKELNRKTKIRYLGPMVVIHHTKGGRYILAEVNGAVSKLHYAAFCLIPYLACSQSNIPISRILDKKEIKKSRQRPTNMDWQMSPRMVSIQAWRRD